MRRPLSHDNHHRGPAEHPLLGGDAVSIYNKADCLHDGQCDCQGLGSRTFRVQLDKAILCCKP